MGYSQTHLCFVWFFSNGQAHYLRFYVPSQEDPSPCTIIVDEFYPNYRGLDGTNSLRHSIRPAIRSSDHLPITEGKQDAKIVEVYARKSADAQEFMKTLCKTHEKVRSPRESDEPGDIEIRNIVNNGYQGNRIDVVFMGDGYTGN